jgi:HAE1 family hydrophobic/amphiphilic exporter-1
MLTAEVQLPPGSGLQVTNDIVVQFETLIDGYVDDVESYWSNVGTSISMMGAMSTAMGGGDNTAEITIMLGPDADVDKERDALDSASEALRGLIAPGSITIYTGEAAMSAQMGFGGLDVSVVGQDREKVNLAASLLYDRIAEIDGISNLEAQLSMVVPSLDVEIDPVKAMALGLTQEQILGVQQEMYLFETGSSLNGVQVGADGESYGVFLKGISRDLYSAEEPEELTRALMVGYPQSVALGDIAQVALVQSPTHISHFDMKFSAGISGTIDEKDVGAVNRLVEDEVDSLLAAPGLEGVDVEMGGVAEEMNENFTRMGIAIVGAMVIAFLTLVLTMRSVVNPIIIMVSLPLASIGALLGLLIGGYTLDMSGMMGVLMLVGIVLTNAIVLIALVEQLRKRGMDTHNALVEGGRTRLRPILMTALTTMVAMVPLAVGVGEGTILAAELAVVVIGGLFSSTLLTLLVIPVIYSLVDGLRQRVRAR